MTKIHPTAIISSSAKIAKGVKVGPYSTVGSNVVLDADVEIISHASIDGYTKIGSGTKIFPFASIGSPPQDLKYVANIRKEPAPHGSDVAAGGFFRIADVRSGFRDCESGGRWPVA